MNRRRLGIALGIALAIVATILLAGLLVFHPGRPLYMKNRSVEIVSADGTVLAGTLSLPRWSRGPVPATVLVHGSGPLAREHVRGDTRRLVWEGIGVLAYDKRGVGESQGTLPRGWGDAAEGVLRTLAADAAAAFAQLRREEGVDPARAGFFGASQAGWIIPLAAESQNPPPRFHVILSGPAISTGVEETYSRLTGDGNRPPQVADATEVRNRVASYAGPAGFDPAPLFLASRVPTLWLLGERDLSVPTFATIRVLESIEAAGNPAHTVIVYPDTGHDLRDAPIWADTRSWFERNGVLRSR